MSADASHGSAPQSQGDTAAIPPAGVGAEALPADGVDGSGQEHGAEEGSGRPRTTAPSATSDDWRTALAGDDESFAEDLEGYESLADVGVLLREQREALSEQPKVPTLPEDATEEQIAEYRQALGIPDSPDGYQIEPPEDYSESEFEQEIIPDFLQAMHDAHVPGSAVKASLDFFRQAQAASDKAATAIDVERQKEWRGELEAKFGDGYETELAAGEAYLDDKFKDDPEGKHDLLRGPGQARRPLQRRRRQPSSRPLAGTPQPQQRPASLAARQEQIERLLFTDKARYNDPATQAELLEIYALRLARGEIDRNGNLVKRKKAL
jgi:hypothetical protein